MSGRLQRRQPVAGAFGPELIMDCLDNKRRPVQIPLRGDGMTYEAHGDKMGPIYFWQHDIQHLFEACQKAPHNVRQFFPRWYRLLDGISGIRVEKPPVLPARRPSDDHIGISERV